MDNIESNKKAESAAEHYVEADLILAALHTHWLNADAVNHHLQRSLNAEPEADMGWLEGIQEFSKTFSKLAVIQVWYALLYVVIKGYLELKENDEVIDKLLQNQENIDFLRRFRNAIFHYQKKPLNEKLTDFLYAEDSEIWIRELNAAFSNFFMSRLPIEKFVEAIKR
jgi:hypothetical protein